MLDHHVDTRTKVLIVTTAAVDVAGLTRLMARATEHSHTEISAVTSATEFFSLKASDEAFQAVIIDERVEWLDWINLVDACRNVWPMSVCLMLTSGDHVSVYDRVRSVGAAFPADRAGLLAAARLLSQMTWQIGQAVAAYVADSEYAMVDPEEEAARDKFAYVVSHDLQDPLQLAKRYADLLSDEYREDLGDDGVRVLDNLLGNLSRTQEMLDELLDYSRLQRAKPQIEAVDLDALIDEVVDIFRLKLDEIGGRVSVPQRLPTLMVDRRQMQRVLQNLIGNAIKFRAERPLEITIRAQQLRGNWRVAIKDNGIGIARKDLVRIFDMFERGPANDDATGTGMGLAICKRILKNHNGRIWVRSLPGHGSVFVFSVPQEPEPDSQATWRGLH
jgi:signal transduction histidine kinase